MQNWDEEFNLTSEDEEVKDVKETTDTNDEQDKTEKLETDTIYAVNQESLENEECKSCAIIILHCFAARRNQWSSNQQLGSIFNRLRCSSRDGARSVYDQKNAWRRIAEKFGYGNDHTSGDDDGCKISNPHRICERKLVVTTDDEETTVHESRIHPTFADKVFSRSDNTIEQLTPLPNRITKKRAGGQTKITTNHVQQQLGNSLKEQRRLLTKQKNKIAELDKIKEDFATNQLKIEQHRKEYLEQEESYRMAKKRRSTTSIQEPPSKKCHKETSDEEFSVNSEEDGECSE
jgi:hypothetical protein